MRARLTMLMNELNASFKERESEIAGSLLALASGEHVLFIGPPGTAKSMLARDLCSCIEEGSFFYYLLTRFTTPDEIFGPLSLSSLQCDLFRRNVEGHMPTANVSFLDEIFKSNSSILNSLLTILNERRYHNGPVVLDVPLHTVFGASNELPEENESLEALYDRFLFRYLIDYVKDDLNFVEVVTGSLREFRPPVKLTMEDLYCIREGSAEIPLDKDVVDSLTSLRGELRSAGMVISDRRWKKAVQVLRVAAHILGRDMVDRTMLMLLQHMIWDRPDELATIRKLLIELVISGGVDLERTGKDLRDLQTSAVMAKDFVPPCSVMCPLCDREFHGWREMRAHSSQRPDHYYVLPGIDERYQLNAVRTSPRPLPNLIDRFASLGRPVVLSMPPEQRELYLEELEEFDDRLRMLEAGVHTERATLTRRLEENIWLSRKDREDLMDHYDDKTRALGEMKRLLQDINAIVMSEEPQSR